MSKYLPQLQIAIGVWVLVSPWVVGFYKFTPALWSSVIAGSCVALIGLWELFGEEDAGEDT